MYKQSQRDYKMKTRTETNSKPPPVKTKLTSSSKAKPATAKKISEYVIFAVRLTTFQSLIRDVLTTMVDVRE